MAASKYLKNKLIDFLWRGQTFVPPATQYVALLKTPMIAGEGGTEVTGGGYARVAITASLTTWSGTQGPGTVVASTGTDGDLSNNVVIQFPAPTGAWGVVTDQAIFDALTGGNILTSSALTDPKTINANDDAPSFAIDTFVHSIS